MDELGFEIKPESIFDAAISDIASPRRFPADYQWPAPDCPRVIKKSSQKRKDKTPKKNRNESNVHKRRYHRSYHNKNHSRVPIKLSFPGNPQPVKNRHKKIIKEKLNQL